MTTPALTLYRDGSANLNGDATRLLSQACACTLLPPGLPGSRWQLLPLATPDPTTTSLRMDRGILRLRCSALAAGLFAALPDSQKSLGLELVPTANGLYKLCPKNGQK
jgi:hypothetical protein